MIYSSFCLIFVCHLFCTFISGKFHLHFCSCHSLQLNHTGLLLLKDNMWQVASGRSDVPHAKPFANLAAI